MSKTIIKSESKRLYVCICEHTLSYRYREKRCFSVKYNHTKGKAGAGMWKKK